MEPPITRQADDTERAAIARRAEQERQAASRFIREERNSGLRVALIFVLVPTVLALFIPFGRGAAGIRLIVFAIGLAYAVFGALSARKVQQKGEQRLAEITRHESARAQKVTEYLLRVERIVTATDELGDGYTWWLLRLDDGNWLVFDEETWSDLAPTHTWHQRVRVVLDGEGTAISLQSEGPEIPVERRELQPPDYTATNDTLFWSPSDEDTGYPILIREDPLARPRKEEG
jgi:hypothetical protein